MSHYSIAQTFEVGGGLGVTQYKGDLNPTLNPLLSRPGINLLARYNFSNGFSLRAEAVLAMLEGNDKLSHNPFNKARDFKFTSLLHEYNVLLEYNFFNFRRYGTYRKSDWTPTLFLGIAAFGLLNQKFYHAGQTDGINHRAVKFPNDALAYGVGFKRKLNSNWNLSGQLGARLLLQKDYRDLLDQVGYAKEPFVYGSSSSYYINSSALDKRLNVPNTKKTPDMYFYTGISLSYVFYGINCPNPRR